MNHHFPRAVGRPPKQVEDLQSATVYVRVTTAEKRAIEAAANGCGIAKWARDVLVRAADREARRRAN